VQQLRLHTPDAIRTPRTYDQEGVRLEETLMARTREKKTAQDPTAALSRGFGRLAALGVILVLAGLVGLVYTGVATLTRCSCSAGCC